MKARLKVKTLFFVHMLRWTVLSMIVGALVGLSTTAFLKSLAWATALFGRNPYSLLALPLVFLASSELVRRLAPEAEGHGTERVIAAIHEKMGRIPLAVIPVKLVATVITLSGGGSAGKEGPCAQIGSGLASAFASLLRLDDVDRRKLVICGVSAGFASVFGTPVGGALMGIEVLFLGRILYDVLYPSFIAGITGFFVSHMLGATFFYRTIPNIPAVSETFFLEMIPMGIWCGLVAILLIEGLALTHKGFKSLPIPPVLKPLLGGTLVAVVGFFVSKDYLGLGLRFIEAGVFGAALSPTAFLWKIGTTSVTLAAGGSGGVVTPIFFVGASAGNIFHLIGGNEHIAAYTAIGMVALLAGAANTPIAASVMAIEFFGPAIAPYAAVACIVSYLVTGHRSVYASQVLFIHKMGMPVTDSTGISVRDVMAAKKAFLDPSSWYSAMRNKRKSAR
ncbi:MAG TPA: chloride channel protein [Candidatus Deferrimicrobiaceae bacterium]|jgi:H+/Cl- antiporter ClcA